MARIRTIKPEFFTSEDIVSMSPLARLFYIALWCEADREGRLEWKPRTLKLRYLPGDDCDISELADELIGSGLIELYEVDGKVYAEIPSFKKHQIINNRESESQIPSRVEHASGTRQARVKAEGKEGREGKGREYSAEQQADSTPPVIKIPLNDGSEHPVTQADVDEWAGLYPAVDVMQELRNMRGWAIANPKKRKTRSGVVKFINAWLASEQDKGGATPQAPPGQQQQQSLSGPLVKPFPQRARA